MRSDSDQPSGFSGSFSSFDSHSLLEPIPSPTPPRSPLKTLLIVGVCMIITQIGWAGFAILIKATTAGPAHHVNPMVFSMLRDAGAVPVLLLVAYLVEGFHQIKLVDVPKLLIAGSVGLFVNQLCNLYGVYLASASDAGVLQPLAPVITCLLSMLVGMEQVGITKVWGWCKIIGILASVGGTLWIVISNNQQSDVNSSKVTGSLSNRVWGMLLILGSATATAVYVILQKKYLFIKDANGVSSYLYPPITATAYMYWFAALELGVSAFVLSFFDNTAFNGLDTHVILPLCYAIFVSSVLCYCLVSYCNTLTTPTIVTAFWPLQTLANVLMSWAFLHERITWVTGVSAVLITLGLFLVCWGKFKEETEMEQIGKLKEETEGLFKTGDGIN